MKYFIYSFVLILLFFYLSVNQVHSQADKHSRIFNKNDYPDSLYYISTQTYSHGKIVIKLIQVKNISKSSRSFSCRVWLTINRYNKALNQIYLDDIEAVGSYYGMFVPNRQPSGNFFTIVKHGDYDGRLYLIDMSGKLTEYRGGAYIVSRFEKYLISEYYSDIPSIDVIDLNNGHLLFQAPDSFPETTQWFFNGDSKTGYYFYTSDDKPDSMYICDMKSNRFIARALDSAIIKESDMINYDFIPPVNNDCGCAKY